VLFSSLPFLIGFLPVVLGITLWLALRFQRRAAVLFLLAASLFFYGYNFAPYILLLGLSIIVNYLIGMRLLAQPSRAMLALGVTFNLALLGWFKYAGFVAANVAAITGADLSISIALPLAISFFTFQQIAYLVDLKRGDVGQSGILSYGFFVAFFPQLIAGPIVHHKDLIPQLSGPRFLGFRADDLRAGALLFGIGFAKKVLIADNIRIPSDRMFDAVSLGIEPSFGEAWVGLLCYCFQIYFDFSGYSDMALGLGRIFGLSLPVNFNSPYKARNIIDFWRRWNMTLSAFLRDYLYIPLGGNRGGLGRHANLMIVMLLGGLWHGASWTFVAWGFLHGLYLIANHAWQRIVKRPAPAVPSLLVTFAVVNVAWVFFRADGFGDAFSVLGAMAGLSAPAAFSVALFDDIASIVAMLAVCFCIVWLVPNSQQISMRVETGEMAPRRAILLMSGLGALVALAFFQVFARGTYEFIYFQF